MDSALRPTAGYAYPQHYTMPTVFPQSPRHSQIHVRTDGQLPLRSAPAPQPHRESQTFSQLISQCFKFEVCLSCTAKGSWPCGWAPTAQTVKALSDISVTAAAGGVGTASAVGVELRWSRRLP
jgi:hypothetical protein